MQPAKLRINFKAANRFFSNRKIVKIAFLGKSHMKFGYLVEFWVWQKHFPCIIHRFGCKYEKTKNDISPKQHKINETRHQPKTQKHLNIHSTKCAYIGVFRFFRFFDNFYAKKSVPKMDLFDNLYWEGINKNVFHKLIELFLKTHFEKATCLFS